MALHHRLDHQSDHPVASRPATRRLALSLAVGLTVAGTLAATVPAAAAPAPSTSSSAVVPFAFHPKPMAKNYAYLALGDSVTFGYREATTRPTPDYSKPASFTSFANDVATAYGLRLTNASCPGETTSSFLNKSKPSNGCENSPGGGPGYRDAFPLHAKYSTTQMRFAVNFLHQHKGTRLVTLMIGANDGLLCQETTANHCATGLPKVLARIAKNVRTIVMRLRNAAHYAGQIVIVNYYATDYSDGNARALSIALNHVIDGAAKGYHVQFANGYGALRRAAVQSQGNACKAGLLTQLSGGGCGIHPSLGGHALLAKAVEAAITK